MFKKLQGQENERGQSLVEMAVILPFLILLVLAVVELSWAFVTYIGVINSSREGAVYASLYPELVDCDDTEPYSDPASIADKCEIYRERIKAETIAMNMDPKNLTITAPDAPDIYANCPITVTVAYSLTMFSSSISLPLFGRMGLPNAYTIRYAGTMPIREADEYCPY